MGQRKTILLALIGVLAMINHVSGVTLYQTDETFISFNAELGDLDDSSTNGSKFDVMSPPAHGSFGDYLSLESTTGSVSFSVDFLDDKQYAVYVRYREAVTMTPQITLTFDGGTPSTSTLYVGTDKPFAWHHLNNSDFTPSGTTPGLVQTVTLTAETGASLAIDAVALVSTSALTRVPPNRFIVSDMTIAENSLTIPEPSTSLLLLLGQVLLLRRRR